MFCVQTAAVGTMIQLTVSSEFSKASDVDTQCRSGTYVLCFQKCNYQEVCAGGK